MKMSIAFSTMVVASLACVCDSYTETYRVYSCPLICKRKREAPNHKRKRDLDYGPKHTFIRIRDTCYDLQKRGLKAIPLSSSCYSNDWRCCTRNSELWYTGTTTCSYRIKDFENAWLRKAKPYDIFVWNCQRYTKALKYFLFWCLRRPEDAIPS